MALIQNIDACEPGRERSTPGGSTGYLALDGSNCASAAKALDGPSSEVRRAFFVGADALMN